VSPALANFLFEAANFLVLAFVLGWLLFRPVRSALDRERESRVAEDTRAREGRAEADRLVQEAREMRQGLEDEMKTRRETLLSGAEREAQRIREEARERQAAELARLQTEMESVQQTEIRALAGPIGRIAAESVRELLRTLDGPSLDEALVGVACRRLKDIPDPARQPATVETARPLEPEVRQMLREVLGESFEERVREDLEAGVRVTTPAGQVDATAVAIARQASDALDAQLEHPTAADHDA